jgi:HAD superfamily hydrolase (TIGR01549 family)
MSKNIAVIFDMDGVLVDSVALNWRAINQALAPHEARVDDDHIAHYLGKTLRDQMVQLNKEYSLTLEFDSFEAAVVKAKVELFASLDAKEGAKPLVDMLQGVGVPYIVATSSTTTLANERLELAGLLDYFPQLVTADHVTKHKPDPAVYLEAAKDLGMQPKQCLVFEDAPAGVQAAKAAGMKCIAISSPYVDVQQLEQADMVVKSMKEVDMHTIQALLEN